MSTVEQEAHNQFDPAILNDPTGVATGFMPIRPGTAIITDSGIYNQQKDIYVFIFFCYIYFST